ncbi:MAG: PqqD family peptide modification chaperone [Candidatus Cryptobacteroides sp.]
MLTINNEKVYASLADGQYVILNIVSGSYYSLNTASSAVLQDLLEGASEAAIAASLSSLHPAADVDSLLKEFIGRLLSLEIVCQDETAAEGPAVNCSALKAEDDALELVVDEFNDVADLLMMDPIHEVKNDSGWPVKQ